MKLQQKRTPVKKPRPNMNDKDSITLDDIEIDLSNYGAAQSSTMIDTQDTITITGSSDYSGISTITLPSINYSGIGATAGYNPNSNCHTLNPSWTTGTIGTSYTINSGPYTLNNTAKVNINADGVDIAEGGDIKIGNVSLKEFIKKMEQRLSILVPDPAKLEKFEALKKAYEHYKTMESLCFDEPIEEETK